MFFKGTQGTRERGRFFAAVIDGEAAPRAFPIAFPFPFLDREHHGCDGPQVPPPDHGVGSALFPWPDGSGAVPSAAEHFQVQPHGGGRRRPAEPLFRVHGNSSSLVGSRIPLAPVPLDVAYCLFRGILRPQPGTETHQPCSVLRIKTCGDEAVVLCLLGVGHGRLISAPLAVPCPCRAGPFARRWA